MPPVAQGPPPEEEKLIFAISLRLVRLPADPRRDRVENEHPDRAEGKKSAQEDVPRRDAAQVSDCIDAVKVDWQQGKRVQLLGLDGLVPLDLRVPVVGEKSHVRGEVVSDSTGELGGS